MKNRRRTSVAAEVLNASRRRFVQGLAAGGTLASLGLFEVSAWAQDKSDQSAGERQV